MKYKLLVGLCALLFSFSIISCDNKTLNTTVATEAIADYMEEMPIYESATFEVGEVKFRLSKEKELIEKYKNLEKEGYIDFSDEITKKKWLSKDSIWTVTIKLTDKAMPYVIEQKSNKLKVKTIDYRVNKDSGIQIEDKNKKSASASVKLLKEVTPFAFLKADSSPHTEFIIRKFKLKYNEDTGWRVAK
ncbi:MAG: hypothetical protein LBI72_08285 [Flavobacteriaceae bacterium]|jgi:hypothetical protein|nr:hypothetical protein [Flavobacteriaceae bacterium]